MMSASDAARDEDFSESEMKEKACMYTDFGTRLYSSVRNPLGAGAYALDDHLKYYSALDGVYQAYPHTQVTRKNALDMAVIMFNKSIDIGSKDWKYVNSCDINLLNQITNSP